MRRVDDNNMEFKRPMVFLKNTIFFSYHFLGRTLNEQNTILYSSRKITFYYYCYILIFTTGRSKGKHAQAQKRIKFMSSSYNIIYLKRTILFDYTRIRFVYVRIKCDNRYRVYNFVSSTMRILI